MPASLTGCSVLVIEDEPLVAIEIRQELQEAGAKVETARTLACAAPIVNSGTPSAVIVDFGLSDGNAVEICATLKARRIPFIVHRLRTLPRYRRRGCRHPQPAPPGALAAALCGALPSCGEAREVTA